MFDTIKKPLRGPVRRAKRGWLMYSEFLRDYRRYRDSAVTSPVAATVRSLPVTVAAPP